MTVEHFIQAIIAISSSYNFWPYWVPIIICLVGYIFKTVKEYNEDVKNRADYLSQPDSAQIQRRYIPELVVGHLVGRLLVSFIPVVNFCIALFVFLPTLARDIIDVCSNWLDIPLVPKKEKATAVEINSY
jgi:hypothetical protein